MPDIMKMGKNPNYLGSWDLEEMPNREATLTIDNIKDEEVVTNGKTETCTVCYWTDKAFKPMILNVTNKKTISKLYKTKDTEKLKGKSVIVGIERVKAFGDVYDALRIRPRMPKLESKAALKCEGCNKDIVAAGSMTSEQVAAYNKNKFGKCLCAECARALHKGAQG
jgi:uncharacterized protein with PIN domain